MISFHTNREAGFELVQITTPENEAGELNFIEANVVD